MPNHPLAITKNDLGSKILKSNSALQNNVVYFSGEGYKLSISHNNLVNREMIFSDFIFSVRAGIDVKPINIIPLKYFMHS